jgi:hypothetical protein
MYDAFLSYKSKERDAVTNMAEALKARNLKIRFDKAELRPGEAGGESVPPGRPRKEISIKIEKIR